MTTSKLSQSLINIVTDLSRPLSADQRYQRLLQAFKNAFPCDATALLKLRGEQLQPLAIVGLGRGTLGRHFDLNDHPRLNQILDSRTPTRFAADSDLPDPYDGLIDGENTTIHVHDCMGASLYIDGQPWGVITLDALVPGTFDQIDMEQLNTFVHLAEATVKAAELIEQLERQVQQEHQVSQAVMAAQQQSMIGKSDAIKALKKEIATVSQSDLTVLVCGETGVGKELVAQALHNQSLRAEQPLIYVNCAALPENLVESELFGHAKGAFSGAQQARSGKFELANGGTLFLDEVGEIPLTTQAKLLRVLQSGEIQRIGSDQHLQVDVRIITATNRNLHDEVAAGRFRADLYHRLSVYPIHVPPLRDRRKDVLLLSGHFLERNRRRMGLPQARLTHDAETALLNYHWPGNIRELEHCISRAQLKAKRDQRYTDTERNPVTTLTNQHLDLPEQPTILEENNHQLTANTNTDIINKRSYQNLKEATDDFQRKMIEATLTQTNNNQSQAAKLLGIDRSNFLRLKRRLNHEEQ